MENMYVDPNEFSASFDSALPTLPFWATLPGLKRSNFLGGPGWAGAFCDSAYLDGFASFAALIGLLDSAGAGSFCFVSLVRLEGCTTLGPATSFIRFLFDGFPASFLRLGA